MDDERLKNPPVGQSVVPDYFDEMLERIRDLFPFKEDVSILSREVPSWCTKDVLTMIYAFSISETDI